MRTQHLRPRSHQAGGSSAGGLDEDRSLRLGERLCDWGRRHERGLIVAWLVTGLLAVGFLGEWGIRFRGADRVIATSIRAWPERVERCRPLVEAGRYEEAAARIERLDAQFPAVHNRHRLVEFREELLRMLGRCYLELGRKRRCLDTFERLVDFEPRTWLNHYELARARLRFGEPAAAGEALAAVLAIHPNHLPAVAELATLHFEAGRFERVVELYEAYLDAFWAWHFAVLLDDLEIGLQLHVDARPHAIDVPIELPEGWKGQLCLASRGLSVRPGRVELHGALRVGSPLASEVVTIATEGAPVWTPRDFEAAGEGLFLARGPGARLCTPAEGPAGGTARLRVELTAYKSVTPELWAMVEKSYRNLLDYAGLEAARERTRIGGWPLVGTVFSHPSWPW